MLRLRLPSLMAVCLLIFGLDAVLHAQEGRQAGSSKTVPRITEIVDEQKLVQLNGQVHPLARAENDQGAVPESLAMPHMLLLLRRSAEQETAFEQVISGMHNPGSPNYQQWLTAEEIGEQFGPAQTDVAAVSGWLESHGFQVNAVYPDGTEIDISGTAGQVRETFHTEIHYYNVHGERHIAGANEPSVPAALASVVEGFSSLSDIFPRPGTHLNLQSVKKDPQSGGWIPVEPQLEFTTTTTINNTPEYLVSPLDFAKIYNVLPLWNAERPITGKGQTIAILADGDIQQADWNTFRAAFGLNSFSGTLTQVHPPTPVGQTPSSNNSCADPGILGINEGGRAEGEFALDTEWSSAVAPDASIWLASCADTNTLPGFLIAAQNMLTGPNPPPIMSVSVAECEQNLGANNTYLNLLWELAVAEGTTVVVGAGDSGPAQCDIFTVGPAKFGLSVSGFSSTPYNVSIGGTDYQDVFQRSQPLYWRSTNSPTGESAKSYVPEMPWNNSCANSLLVRFEGFLNGPSFCDSAAGANFLNTVAGGGGASIIYTKPTWQNGIFGVPNDGRRDLPDIAFPAASGAFGHAMLLCMSDPNGGGGPCNYNNPNDVVLNAGGGTSFGGPMFAGVQALINQKAGGRQGASNYVLYKLGAEQYGSSSRPNLLGLILCDANLGFLIGQTCVFHDVSVGDNSVSCVAGSPNCYAQTGAAVGVISTSTTSLQPAFRATPGWDFASGLGSPNVANLVNSWPAARGH